MSTRPAAATPATDPTVVLVVPCYNEAARLEPEAFERQLEVMPNLTLLFVDDGSTDATRAVLDDIRARWGDRVQVLGLGRNCGKAEAVRSGVLHSEGLGADLVGYWDADLATPIGELPAFVAQFADPDLLLVLGSRVNLLGRRIRRTPSRHYLGRFFASIVAVTLDLPVYDTQCGAKLMRATPAMYALFRNPFHSTWIFDTEILVRLSEDLRKRGRPGLDAVAREHPLEQWADVSGSTINLSSYVRASKDTMRIFAHHTASERFSKGLGGISKRVARVVRDVLCRASTDRTDVSALGKAWRTAVTVPAFGVLLVWMRVRAWVLSPLVLDADTRTAQRFRVRLPDFIQTYLYLFGIWEPDVTRFLQRRLSPGDTFVDVGANIGYHSLLAHHAMDGRGAIVAVEASPQIAGWLDESIRSNGATDSIRVVRAAASRARGTLTMYSGPDKNTGLSTSVAQRGMAREAIVPCAPLHELLNEDEIASLRILKIDVEGAEDEVIAGLGRILTDAPNDLEIVLELSPQWWADDQLTPATVLQPLFDAGFHAYEIDNNLWPWRYLWANEVAAPRRARRNWDAKPRRIDLVLSRVDAPSL